MLCSGLSDTAFPPCRYEDDRLQTAQHTQERRQTLAEQQSRLQSQLEYERERDLAAPLAEAEKRMADTVSQLAGPSPLLPLLHYASLVPLLMVL
jgi:uncharacterized surface protein with fasciclin (FAS1) repeats